MVTLVNTLDAAAALNMLTEHYKDSPAVVRATQRLQLVLISHARNMLKPESKRKPNKDPAKLTKGEQTKVREHYGKIPAIKMVRERCGCGLKEAKDGVEAWMQANLGFTHYPTPVPLDPPDSSCEPTNGW